PATAPVTIYILSLHDARPILLRAICGEKSKEVRDTSLKVPHGESGTVIGVRIFDRDEDDELPAGVNQLVRVYVAHKRKITDGDRSEEHTSELQSRFDLVCRLL